MTTIALIVLFVLPILSVAASPGTSRRQIPLPGATGSGPFRVAEGWATAFSALYPEAEITLTWVGSGVTRSALWGEIDCDTKPVKALCSDGASSSNDEVGSTICGLGDAPIGDNVYQKHPPLRLQQLPACAGVPWLSI